MWSRKTYKDKFLLEVKNSYVWINLKTKHKYHILTLVIIIPISVWVAFLSIPPGGRDDPLAGLVIIIISVIIYFVAFSQISKIEKHSEV